jgi:C4-dicarboxylate-specific signal transduction histidine kinase
MSFKGLKISIAINFAVLLMIGMLLVNMVGITLWQKHILAIAADQGRSLLTHLVEGQLQLCGQNDKELLEILSQRKDAVNIDAEFLLYRDNRLLTSSPDVSDYRVIDAMRHSAQTQSEVIDSTASLWFNFGWIAKDVIVASPLERYCKDIDSLGVVVQVSKPNEYIADKQSIILAYILVNLIVLTTIGFFRMTKLVVKPLEKLVDLSESFNIQKPDILAAPARKNEFSNVAAALQNMFFRIEEDKKKLKNTVSSLENANKLILDNQEKLIETEKFAAVGRLSAGLAHEIGNPLGIIQGYLELLERDDLEQLDRHQYSRRATKELERMTRLIRQLLDFAGKKNDAHSRASVFPVINELLEILRYQKIVEKIRFEVECEDFPEQANCSEADLHQVLLNCVLNSIDAIGEQDNNNGVIAISCKLVPEETGKIAEIEIRDNGGGVKHSDISSVFDPFFTTKDVGHGTGLGLSVSRSIVENSGGTIHMESEKSIGTCVVIKLPVA